jgi:hypothetical protein
MDIEFGTNLDAFQIFRKLRPVGKPRKRWEDAVQQDAASFMRCRNWKVAANDRTLWRQKIEEAKA